MTLVTGNPEYDFFEQNPELKVVGVFKRLLEEETPEFASKVAWAIYLTEDPNSKLYRMQRELRRAEVAKNFLDNPRFNWGKYDYLINAYGRICLTKEAALFKIWADELDELTAFLKQLSHDDERESRRKVQIMKDMEKIWKSYEAVKAKMIESEKESQLRGGGKLSVRQTRKTKKDKNE